MDNLLRTLLLLVAASVGTNSANADQLSDLENQTALVEAKKKLATKGLELAELQKQLAEKERDIAAARLKAAQDALATAQEALKQVPPVIRVSSGTLTVINSDPLLSCNAKPFLRWKCHRVDSCDFVVNETMCGLPGASTAPMILTVEYECDGQRIEDAFRYGQPAYLTCK